MPEIKVSSKILSQTTFHINQLERKIRLAVDKKKVAKDRVEYKIAICEVDALEKELKKVKQYYAKMV